MANDKRMRYRFWRWLILTILHFPKLYALVWGMLLLLGVVLLKIDIIELIKGLR